MKLNVLEGENRFIVSPSQLDVPFHIPPIEFGNVCPVELRVFRKAANGAIYAVDVSTYEISLLVGPPNARPSLGFWTLTTTTGESGALASRATKEEVKAAMGSAVGDVTVVGGDGSYIITLNSVGVWALPTASFQGNTLSSVLVFQITPGTTTTPAQYRVEVLEVAPARVIPEDWSTGSTTPTNTFTLVNGKLWQLILSPEINNGFFTLTVDGITTEFISFFAGAAEISVALSAIGKPATVQDNGTGGFFVMFASTVTTASVGGNLVILPFQESSLDVTSTGIRELLDGVQFNTARLSVILVKDGQTTTVASADVILQMPINQPATITIDAPQMAGLTFAIEAPYMHVYLNGVLQYDIPLNAP